MIHICLAVLKYECSYETIKYYIEAIILHLCTFTPVHVILVFIAYTQTSPLNAHAGVSNEGRALKFGLNLHLYQLFVHVSTEGPAEYPHMPSMPEPSMLKNAISTTNS